MLSRLTFWSFFSGLVEVQSGSNSVSELPDFTSLSSQIATVSPTIVQEASYTPTNSAQACPSPNANFSAVASPLPPTPDATLCECMYNASTCVPSSHANTSEFGTLFNYVCGIQGKDYCNGITSNGSTGMYGKYSFCNPVQQLGYVLNRYYSENGESASACSFSGSAVVRSPVVTGVCAKALSTSSIPPSGGSGGSGGNSGSAASSGSKGAANMNAIYGARSSGLAAFAVLVPVAIVSGIGMLLL